MKDLCDLMAKNTTVGRADIYAVLEQLSDSIRYLVGLGMNVDLAGLATFRGTFKSQGVENKEDFNPRMHISKPAIGCILKRSFKELNGVTYEQVEVANKTNSNTPTPSQPSNTGDNSGGGEQGSTQVEVANKTNSNTPTPSQPSNTGDNSGGGEQGSTGGGL
uniref:HU family DNA-binding protein n=1 Tax=Porphyromonas gulae TaxID=111105 RepID=UPI001F38E884|nr:DNA-binding protein [Porphyromonas gulae]